MADPQYIADCPWCKTAENLWRDHELYHSDPSSNDMMKRWRYPRYVSWVACSKCKCRGPSSGMYMEEDMAMKEAWILWNYWCEQ